MISKNLVSKTIDSLCVKVNGKKLRFHVPTYQRGYRWTVEATKLLDDLWDFSQAKKGNVNEVVRENLGNFYCLQPIMVKERQESIDERPLSGDENHYEVIDGQQRLTTILLLLKYFGNTELFFISFDRDNCQKLERENFILSILPKQELDVPKDKVDLYFITKVNNEICKWFEKKAAVTSRTINSINNQMQTQLNDDTKIIWYELENDNTDVHQKFTNINSRRIPLTNSELIKAMMLNSRYHGRGASGKSKLDLINLEQKRIARLWDEIENAFEVDEFFGFIAGTNALQFPAPRIDFLFEYIYKSDCSHSLAKDKRQRDAEILSYFESLLNGTNPVECLKKIDNLFETIRNTFRVFQDWYNDITYYNYIGFETYFSKDVFMELKRIHYEYKTKTKSDFIASFEIKYKDIANGIDKTLNYKDHYEKIKKILLLFNVESSNKKNHRFNFIVPGDWSIEHIFPQHAEKILVKDRADWIKRYIDIAENALRLEPKNKDVKDLIVELKAYSGKNEEFDSLFEKILKNIEGKGAEIDTLPNLALLGGSDNSSLKNSPFSEKRKKIIDMIENGNKKTENSNVTIPLCTANVFMKFYSGIGTNLDYWSEQDGTAYLKKIKTTLRYDQEVK